MDPGAPKSSSTPAAGTVAEPFRDRPAVSDTFLGPPQRPDELGRVGPYRLLAELGRGGMGVVFRAEDTQLHRPVAVKVLLPAAAADPRAVARFRREAEAQAKVDHEHVTPIYSVGEADGIAFLVMPLLKGQTLAAALKLNPRPPLSAVARIGREIAEGLAAAHAVGLIHRDIKPGNIWLEGDKLRVKILDFGLARVSAERVESAQPIGTGPSLTTTGAIMGTPAYMAPEQTRSQPTDNRTDLFSLGVVLYQMATGELPFTGGNLFDVMAAVVAHNPPPAHERNPEVPLALSELIWRLMAKNPAERPQSADAVADTLDALGRAPVEPPVRAVRPRAARAEPDPWTDLNTAADDPTQVETAPGRARPRRSRKGLRFGAAVSLIGVPLLALLALVTRGEKSKPTEPSARNPVPALSPPKVTPPPKKEPPEPEPDHEREAAEKLIRFAGLRLVVAGEGARDAPVGGELPPGKFSVAAIDFANAPDRQFKESFVSDTFLPAVSHLRELAAVRDGWVLRLSSDHLRRMAGMPLAGTLRVLQMSVVLTPEAVPELKKFGALTEVILFPPKPSDDLFTRLAELTHLKRLSFSQLGRRPDLTDKGWAAVAAMPLESFRLYAVRGAPDALRAFAARSGPLPALEFWECRDLTDANLRDHLKPTTDVKRLVFRWCDLTDACLTALAEVQSLRELELQATNITQKGSQALFEARPDLQITYSLKK